MRNLEALLLAFAVCAAPGTVLAPPVAVTCTFSNPSYAGDCVEKATRQEKEKAEAACQSILDCLNDARCVKTYCRSTTIRQGWTLKSAE